MAKTCPQTGEKVLYLECVECDERGICGKLVKEKDNEENDSAYDFF